MNECVFTCAHLSEVGFVLRRFVWRPETGLGSANQRHCTVFLYLFSVKCVCFSGLNRQYNLKTEYLIKNKFSVLKIFVTFYLSWIFNRGYLFKKFCANKILDNMFRIFV